MISFMDEINNGAGTSRSGICSISEVSCWNNKCNYYGTLVYVPEL
ncbi:MAG: hypothetical protein E7L18_06240 [Finegoldia magna]|nr:hypothetical protein [Finegoldia magna]MDU7331087.1 hypothetical protein [Finegoldia magna]